MKCRHAKRLIYDFIDGLIGEEDRSLLERHLAECSACEAMADGLSKSLDFLHRIESVEPGENFTWKVRLRIARERQVAPDSAVTARTWLRSWNRRFALSALSTMVVVVGAGYFALNTVFLPSGGDSVRARVMSTKRGQDGMVAAQSVPPEKTTGAVTLPPTAGRAEFVSGGGPVQDDPTPAGPLEEDAVGFSLPESLLLGQQLVRSETRARLLQQRVETLSRQLRECREGKDPGRP